MSDLTFEGGVAIGFPGQGPHEPQKMGQLLDQYPVAAETIQEAEEILAAPLTNLLIGDRDPATTTTRDDQLRIYLGSAALWRTAEERGIVPNYKRVFYGLSAGELTALYAAGAYDFEVGLRLIDVRGEEMHKASIINPGEMLVATGLQFEEALDMAEQIPGVHAVNDNPGPQSVFAGTRFAVELAAAQLTERWQGIKLYRPDIKVAAHSWHMAPAAEGLKEAIRNVKLKKPVHDFMGNQAKLLSSAKDIRQHLVDQLTRGVLLRESARQLYYKYDVRDFYDVGPAKVLYGLMRREFRKTVNVVSVVDELLPEK